MIAWELATKLQDNEDPWPLADKVLRDPKANLSADLAKDISKLQIESWKRIPKERIALRKLLSRFEILPDQAKQIYVQEERDEAGIKCTDREVVENPYVIFEQTRLTANPISIWTIDRGVFPEEVIRGDYESKYEISGDRLMAERRLEIRISEISGKRWREHMSFCQTADADANQRIMPKADSLQYRLNSEKEDAGKIHTIAYKAFENRDFGTAMKLFKRVTELEPAQDAGDGKGPVAACKPRLPFDRSGYFARCPAIPGKVRVKLIDAGQWLDATA